MPSRQKIIYFMACACCTSLAVGLLGFGMSQTWAESRLECSRGNNTFDGSAVIIWDLFSGLYQGKNCPLIGFNDEFDVFPELKDSGAPVILCALVVLFLVVSLLCSACNVLIALYNSVSNPYETYMGPIGLYVCSSISACLSALVLILYGVTVSASNMAEAVVENNSQGVAVLTRNKRTVLHLGFYLVIPYTVLSLAAIAVVYLYAHAAYTQRREQQRPTEDAPKEVMMY